MNGKLESVRATMWRHLVKATEVTAGLAESNGSLPPPKNSLSLQHYVCYFAVTITI